MEDLHTGATALQEWLLNGGYDDKGEREWKSPFNLHYKTDMVLYEWLSPAGVGRFAQAMNGTRYWEELGNMSTGTLIYCGTNVCDGNRRSVQGSLGQISRRTRWWSTSEGGWARLL